MVLDFSSKKDLELNNRGWKRLWKNVGARSSAVLVVALILLIGAFISTRWFDTPASILAMPPWWSSGKPAILKPLTCPSPENKTIMCSSSDIPPSFSYQNSSNSTCPEYFRWIHEDLRPWKEKGITSDMVERAKRTANFRLVVVKGKAYVEIYSRPYQTRDVFTIWGILQLLRRYQGKMPDFEMMFDCNDYPRITPSPNPSPLFRYCGNDHTLDIVFPDWSFWGWAETNIKPWNSLVDEMKEGNQKIEWINRDPYAYWKGNPGVAPTRGDLMKCNVSDTKDWNARLYAQDWIKESQEGYKQSNLANQCTHRYKIYIEGSAWSVSEKYILACDSPTLFVTPRFYDFFTRALVPLKHYWPIRDNAKCRSIKFAVDWGNTHKEEVQAIGKAASGFILEDMKMDYVYDYMFHLIREYSKLLRYKPSIPKNAIEYCSEYMACPAQGIENKFMRESMVNSITDVSPCILPPPFDPQSLQEFLKRKANGIKQVEDWEQEAWRKQ